MPVPTQGYIYIDNQKIAFNVPQNFEDNGFSVDNDGYALYNGKRFYYNGTLVLGTDEPLDGEYYWTIIDLTGYTWVGNDSLSFGMDTIFSIDFICNSNNYTSITIEETTYRVSYNTTRVVNFGHWTSDVYKTITITGGTDSTNQTLIAWLESNGTLTAPQPSQTNKIFIGSNSIDNVYFGSTEVQSMYLGDVKIYEKGS